jgi:hypothetical protein
LEYITTKRESGQTKTRRRGIKHTHSAREVHEIGFEEHPLHDIAPAYAYVRKPVIEKRI